MWGDRSAGAVSQCGAGGAGAGVCRGPGDGERRRSAFRMGRCCGKRRQLIAASESEKVRSLVNVSPESEICLHYDVQNGIVKEAEDDFYCLRISLKKDGTLVEAQIDVRAEDELVYSLQTAANWRGGKKMKREPIRTGWLSLLSWSLWCVWRCWGCFLW